MTDPAEYTHRDQDARDQAWMDSTQELLQVREHEEMEQEEARAGNLRRVSDAAEERALVQQEFDAARRHLEAAIRTAAAAGITHRAIAEAANLTRGRISQIAGATRLRGDGAYR